LLLKRITHVPKKSRLIHCVLLSSDGSLVMRDCIVTAPKGSGLDINGRADIERVIVGGCAHNGLTVCKGPSSEPSLRLRDCCVFDNGLNGLFIQDGRADCASSRFSRNLCGVFGLSELPLCRCYNNLVDFRHREASETVQSLADKALVAGKCPVAMAGPYWVAMEIWDCETCGFTDDFLLCAPCAQEHAAAGHEGVAFREMGEESLCDCGSGCIYLARPQFATSGK
jgi:hypothetical protein